MLDACPAALDGTAAESLRAYLLFVAEQHLDPDLRAKAGASDLVQQTLLNAHARRDSFRGGTPEELRGWLRGILMHLLHNHRDHYRHAQSRRVDLEVPLDATAPPPAPGETPSRVFCQGETHDQLNEAVGRLTPDQRQAVALRFEAGCTFAEIGERTGRSEDAARMLVRRAVERFREMLATMEP